MTRTVDACFPVIFLTASYTIVAKISKKNRLRFLEVGPTDFSQAYVNNLAVLCNTRSQCLLFIIAVVAIENSQY